MALGRVTLGGLKYPPIAREGSNGVRAPLRRPSSTRSATSSPVNGARVIPSVAWPAATCSPSRPGTGADERQAVGGQRAHPRPVARARRHPPPRQRLLRRCRDRAQTPFAQTQAARAELERARHTHHPVVRADRDLRRLQVHGLARPGLIGRVRPAVALGRDNREPHTEPRQQTGRRHAAGEHDCIAGAASAPAATPIQPVPSRPSAATPECSSTSAPPATTARRRPSQNDSGRTRRSTRAISPPSTRSLSAGSTARNSAAEISSSSGAAPTPMSSSATPRRCSSSACSNAGYSSGALWSSNSTPRSASRSKAGPASAPACWSAASPRL